MKNLKNISEIERNKCTGCSAYVAVCPSYAITMYTEDIRRQYLGCGFLISLLKYIL